MEFENEERHAAWFYAALAEELNRIRPEFRQFIYRHCVASVWWSEVQNATIEKYEYGRLEEKQQAERILNADSCCIVNQHMIAEVRYYVDELNKCLSSMGSV